MTWKEIQISDDFLLDVKTFMIKKFSELYPFEKRNDETLFYLPDGYKMHILSFYSAGRYDTVHKAVFKIEKEQQTWYHIHNADCKSQPYILRIYLSKEYRQRLHSFCFVARHKYQWLFDHIPVVNEYERAVLLL